MQRISNLGDKMKDKEATKWRVSMQITRGFEGARNLKVTNKDLRTRPTPHLGIPCKITQTHRHLDVSDPYKWAASTFKNNLSCTIS